MSEDILDEEVEEVINRLAEQKSLDMGAFPEPAFRDTVLRLMRDVRKEEDPDKLARTANFREEEVGKPKVPSLTYMHVANYADIEGHKEVADYLRSKTGALASLSLGRKAKLLETLFTVRRETRNLASPKETTKKTLFGTETTTKEGVDT